jgi:hypothetical protein
VLPGEEADPAGTAAGELAWAEFTAGAGSEQAVASAVVPIVAASSVMTRRARRVRRPWLPRAGRVAARAGPRSDPGGR